MRPCIGVMLMAAFCAVPVCAKAGAWTLPEGVTQIISTTTLSDASKSYNTNGDADNRMAFHKLFVSAYSEYGWNDWLTIVAEPEFASATFATPSRVTQKADDFAFSGGARLRLLDDYGVLSIQAMVRSAGAFELDTSVNQNRGNDFELRVLYGTHFEIFGHGGCFDAQIANRWTTGGRPNEMPIDLSVLYDVGYDTQALLQNFNVFTDGTARPPFGHYRFHKLAFSVVHPVWDRFSIQLGVFASPAGQNALEEQGVFIGLWSRF